jgi:hypothetical protein
MKSLWLPLLALSLFATATLQAQQIQFAYTNNGDGTVTVTEAYYTSYFAHAGPAFTIPSTYNRMPVTCIGSGFSEPWGLYFTNITIPASITNIADYAFEDDYNLNSIYFEGSPPTVGIYAFETHSQGNTTAYYLASMDGWGTDTNGFPTNDIFDEFEQDGVNWEAWTPPTGSLQVALSPAAAVAAGVQWEVDGGTNNDNGAIASGLVTGSHVVSFVSVPGWSAPPNQTVTIKKESTTKIKANFTAWPPNTAPLTVQVVGGGAISPNDNGKLLKIGQTYTLTAESNPNVFFTGWAASGSENFVSNNPVLRFKMRSNLVLQASFIPNPFADVAGQYIGLFMPQVENTLQNSGYATLTITTKGTFSGYLQTGTTRHILSGQLDTNFDYTNTISIPGDGPVTIGLNAAPGYSSINGTITSTNWSSAIEMVQTDHGVISYDGEGTYSIAFTDAAGGEGGSAVAVFAKRGAATFSGRLPDGTHFSASSFFSDSATWPFYAPLYGGKGYLMGWMSVGPGDGGTDYSHFTADGSFVWLLPAGPVQHLSAGSQ